MFSVLRRCAFGPSELKDFPLTRLEPGRFPALSFTRISPIVSLTGDASHLAFLAEVLLTCQVLTSHVRGNFELEISTTVRAGGWVHISAPGPCCETAVRQGPRVPAIHMVVMGEMG